MVKTQKNIPFAAHPPPPLFSTRQHVSPKKQLKQKRQLLYEQKAAGALSSAEELLRKQLRHEGMDKAIQYLILAMDQVNGRNVEAAIRLLKKANECYCSASKDKVTPVTTSYFFRDFSRV